MSFSTDPTAKLKILSLDEGNAEVVVAQFNPKELQIDKTVPWQKHKDSKSDSPHLEFTGGEPMAMSFELLFDASEAANGDIQKQIDNLLKLARIIEDEKRPHHIQIIWGDAANLPEFKGVIESVSTKYQMFSKTGKPLRAIATVKCKQASELSFKKK